MKKNNYWVVKRDACVIHGFDELKRALDYAISEANEQLDNSKETLCYYVYTNGIDLSEEGKHDRVHVLVYRGIDDVDDSRLLTVYTIDKV